MTCFYSCMFEYSLSYEQFWHSDPRAAAAMDEVLTLTDLEQVRVLADPLRLRILELLKRGEPLTTKQVAERLGEKPTRLYHHVEALERIGVIRLVETRPNRGTTEKYYQAVARTVVAHPAAFTPAPGREREVGGVLAQMFESVLGAARAQVRRSFATGLIGPRGDPRPVLMHLPIKATPAGIERLKRRLETFVRVAHAAPPARATTTYAIVIACYPVDEDNPDATQEPTS